MDSISTITTNVTYEEMSGMKEIVPLLESDDSIFKHLTENASGAISIKISDNTSDVIVLKLVILY